MIDNEFVQKAEDELEYINSDEEERARAKFREKAEWNYNAGMKSMYAEGRKDSIKEIAKKMLEQGLDIEIIMNATGLSKEEVEKLNS